MINRDTQIIEIIEYHLGGNASLQRTQNATVEPLAKWDHVEIG